MDHKPNTDFVYGREIEARAQELSNYSAKSTSKRDKAVQKRSFRDVLNTITSRGLRSPSETLKLKTDEIVFSGWAQLVRLEALRAVVGESLNTHLVHNERLREVFGFAAVSEGAGVNWDGKKSWRRVRALMFCVGPAEGDGIRAPARAKDAIAEHERRASREKVGERRSLTRVTLLVDVLWI